MTKIDHDEYTQRQTGHWVEFDLDIPAIVRDYARQYVLNSSAHESLDEFADRVSLDLKMPKAKVWAKQAVKELQKEMVTA